MIWLLPSIYLIFLFVLTIKGIDKQKTDSSYFFDSYKTHWIYSLISLFATEVSVATILIFPSLGYEKNLNIIFLCLGYILGRFIVAKFYLKKYHKISKLSLYEHISEENSKHYLSFIYLFAKYISGSVRFYLAAYGMYQLTNIPIVIWLFIIAFVVAFYSASGGLKSVILTDQFQGWIVFLSGFILLTFLILKGTPQFSIQNDIVQNLKAKDSFALFFGSLLLTISTHGADQDLLQRIFSVGEYQKAKLALILSGFISSFVILIFFFIGFLLKSNMDLNPKSPLLDFIMNLSDNQSSLVLLKSLFIVLMMATSMSTLDSSIHSTGAIWKSILIKKIKIKNYHYSLLSLLLMLLFSMIFIRLEKIKDFFSLAFGFMNFINGSLFSFITIYVLYQKKLTKYLIVVISITNIVIVSFCEAMNLFWPITTIISFLSSLIIGLLMISKLDNKMT